VEEEEAIEAEEEDVAVEGMYTLHLSQILLK
jgi:hypothetical protein